jgi:polar amino acid transport system substrate-binding protein
MKLMINMVGVAAIVAVSAVTTFLNNFRFPRDAEDSLDKIQNNSIRVGFTNATPWVWPSGDSASGIEAEIVTEFAKSLNAKVEWVEGTEEQLYDALKKDEIDMLVAGITAKTPWKEEVGLTKPYIETQIVIGQHPSQKLNAQSPIEGQWVAVKKGTDEGYFVRKKKAKPFYTSQLPANNMLSAGYDWQLQKWNLQSTGIVLEKESHVIAVPPGENGFLLALDKYLFLHKESIRKQLIIKG